MSLHTYLCIGMSVMFLAIAIGLIVYNIMYPSPSLDSTTGKQSETVWINTSTDTSKISSYSLPNSAIQSIQWSAVIPPIIASLGFLVMIFV